MGGTDDIGIEEIVQFLWFFYDDIYDEPICVDPETYAVLVRVATFLRTDLEYDPRMETSEHWAEYWPFPTADQYCSHRLTEYQLPPYDPALMPVYPDRPSILRALARLTAMVLASIALLVGLVYTLSLVL